RRSGSADRRRWRSDERFACRGQRRVARERRPRDGHVRAAAPRPDLQRCRGSGEAPEGQRGEPDRRRRRQDDSRVRSRVPGDDDRAARPGAEDARCGYREGRHRSGEELVMPNVIVVGVVAVLASLIVLAMILSRIIYICPPNEVLIFSGSHRKLGTEERVVGYRVVQGGRGIRIPLIEVVDRMDLTNMMIELRVQGAYSKGGIPLNVQGVANVKVSSKSDQLANA